MTEREWATGTDPAALLNAIAATATPRKLRLLAAACCRRHWPSLTDPRSRAAVEAAERFADGSGELRHLDAAYDGAYEAAERHHAVVARKGWTAAHLGESRTVTDEVVRVWVDGASAAAYAACYAARPWIDAGVENARMIVALIPAAAGHVAEPVLRDSADPRRRGAALEAERSGIAAVLRCVFNNPFRPVAFLAEWRTETAVALARSMYDARDFGAMPVLADALEEAGCDAADVLAHCRGPGPHCRGCWVVDAVLGRA